MMDIDERLAIVTTLFLPSEGAASGEAGELMYYRFLEDEPTVSVMPIVEESSSFKIFPNPAQNLIRVEMDSNDPILKYTIIDLLGNQKLRGILKEESSGINTSKLHTGTYILQLENHETKMFEVVRK
jgi:hypothetical protein